MELRDIIQGTWTITNGIIDVEGSVELWGKGLQEIPFKFGKVSGTFNISQNKLTSLKGSPEFVGSNFHCSENNLTDLIGSPNYVSGNFICSYNNLTDLKGAPEIVGGDFYCDNNKLTSLVGCPNTKHLSIHTNKLYDFLGIGRFETIKCGETWSPDTAPFLRQNPVYEIFSLCLIDSSFRSPISQKRQRDFINYLNEFSVIRGETRPHGGVSSMTILGKRLDDALYFSDIENVDVTKLTFRNYTLLE